MIAHIPTHIPAERIRKALASEGLQLRAEIKSGGQRHVVVESAPSYPDGYCGECKQPCQLVEVNFGHGERRYAGATNKQWVSDCCDEIVYEDEDLKVEAEPS